MIPRGKSPPGPSGQGRGCGFLVLAGSIPGTPGVGSGSFFRQFWDVLGSVWEWYGDSFRHILEGFEKMSDGVRKLNFSKMAGSIFPESGRFRIAFLTYPRSKHIKFRKFKFYRKFPYIMFGVFAGVMLTP